MKVGDQVSVISDVIKGKIIKINGDQISIEDEFGFERTYSKSDLVLSKGEKSWTSQCANEVLVSDSSRIVYTA